MIEDMGEAESMEFSVEIKRMTFKNRRYCDRKKI